MRTKEIKNNEITFLVRRTKKDSLFQADKIIEYSDIREDTHKKNVFFRGHTTKDFDNFFFSPIFGLKKPDL